MTPETISFGPHELQRVSVFQETGNTAAMSGDKFWIIYIHGGAWRDPTVTELSFLPTIRHLYLLKQQQRVLSHIEGFASISYRLSPHPDYPQDSSTPIHERRCAVHPDHLQDVIAGLSALQEKYRFGNRYVLVGHSCGATLAFQSLMAVNILDSPAAFKKPSIIIGVAGIYDVRALRDAHPSYQDFISTAFGVKEELWDAVSPAKFRDFRASWLGGRMVVLATSSRDELVDAAQVEKMEIALGASEDIDIHVWKGLMNYAHNEIWESNALAQIIENVLSLFFSEQ